MKTHCHPYREPRFPRLYCTYCGAELPVGSPYWLINGTVLCPACLPEFARQDYRGCFYIRGLELPS